MIPAQYLFARKIAGAALATVVALLTACTTTPPPSEPIPPPAKKGITFTSSDYADLPAVDGHRWEAALTAFRQSCSRIRIDAVWSGLCSTALSLPNSAPAAESFFRSNFTPWGVEIPAKKGRTSTGLMTGYYEPLLYGSRVRQPPYVHPIYGIPDNLLTIDLGEIYPDLKGRRLRGKLDGRRVVPYDKRGAIQEKEAEMALRTVEMNFLPDVKVLCEACAGKRFNPETLEVLWRGKSIGDVLEMEIDEAVDFFASMPSIAYPFKLMQDVGLGYLTLGQPSPTLSGGEAQRLKLVTELAKVRTDGSFAARAPHTLYVLDEPTVGLHMTDVDRLSKVLSRLVDAGSTVVVIEHNLDIAADADWIIDLGPEGGAKGGKVVAQGSPKMVARKNTATGIVLRAFLAEHKPVKST